ncbi:MULTISPECIES: alcohol dehydrogenase catalytic domain-containing protein [Chelatococcus]|uniref:NADPH:quinone reductase-like Zn-dependent oxidoreductase n=1 Tax=Chelatococcus caeni TaxID=1348468 RepID=A0A840C7V3_9HYPH|nr:MULTISPECIES: alcohol dehydrogenase catalytic domain-containing protein [Chelatococcus]MBB4019489.1 NADPH:quinone reductase-like Zn-dependent oxidoreductase [Chelatococcus caeni]
MEVAEPKLRDADLLVDIRAVGVNPGEALIRSVRSAGADGRVILGWEFAGVVLQVGSKAKGFAVGTRLDGLTAENMKTAHEQLESRRTIGKIVIAA